jgi:hypothetical protein
MALSTGPILRLLLRSVVEIDGLIGVHLFSLLQSIVSKDEAAKNARLKILRKRLEQHFQKYFWDLCAIGDANNDGNIDLGMLRMLAAGSDMANEIFHCFRRMARCHE